jgi:GT2 family glycosyltransferase
MPPENNMPKVSILILNWNNYSDTEKCIESILKIEYVGFLEIVCIDNGSTDDSFVKLREKFRNLREILFIHNKINLGYGGGINAGISYVIKKHSVDFVWILNNDIVVDRNSLRELIKGMQSHPLVGIAGPTIYYVGTDQVMEQYYDLSLLQGRFIVKTDLDDHVVTIVNNKRKRYIGGAAVFLRMAALEDIRLIPEEYFMYNEDVAWHQGIKGAHWEYLYVGPAKVWHKKSASSGGRKAVMPDYYDTRNFLYFIKKYYPSWLFYEIFMSIINKVLPKILRREWERLKYVMFGFQDFFKGKMGKFEN